MSDTSPTSITALRVVLATTSAFIVFTGVNIAFGGMLTLGLQGQTDFLTVTSEYGYLAQDSHVRFLGGAWMGIGILFLAATANVQRFLPMLNLACGLIFLGGLTRFSMLRPDIIFGPDVVGSLIAELVLVPILFVWLSRVAKLTAVRHASV